MTDIKAHKKQQNKAQVKADHLQMLWIPLGSNGYEVNVLNYDH